MLQSPLRKPWKSLALNSQIVQQAGAGDSVSLRCGVQEGPRAWCPPTVPTSHTDYSPLPGYHGQGTKAMLIKGLFFLYFHNLAESTQNWIP